mmetsp:Transcript_4234/g.7543  ORF Transcript_4234/g.7543 Transcript_4234/m.7543 type:complete len:542 (-) Transcript_4234:507-2132(-)
MKSLFLLIMASLLFTKTLQREVSRFEQQHIKQGTALGELDHPNYASRYFKCLNLPNVSHQVLEVKWKGNQLWGTIEVLPTPSGLLLWELYSQGIRLGVSSRGWASLKSDATQSCLVVDDDFELITFDFVTEPSTKDAYLVPVQKAYRRNLPSQEKCVQTAHLGHGVVSMDKITRLPPASVLVQRIAELQRAIASGGGGGGGDSSLLVQVPGEKGNIGNSTNNNVNSNGNHMDINSSEGINPSPYPSANNSSQHVYSSNNSTGSTYSRNSLDNLLKFSHYLVHQDAPYLDREQHARDYRAHLAIFATRAHLADQQQLLSSKALDHVILHEIASRARFDPASKSFATALGYPKAQPLNDSFQKNAPEIERLVSASAFATQTGTGRGGGGRVGEGGGNTSTGGGTIGGCGGGHRIHPLPNTPPSSTSQQQALQHQYQEQQQYLQSPPSHLQSPSLSLPTPPLTQNQPFPLSPSSQPPLMSRPMMSSLASALCAEQELLKQRADVAAEFVKIQNTLASYAQLYEQHQLKVEKQLSDKGGITSRKM